MSNYVQSPEAMSPLFEQAEKILKERFDELERDPSQAKIYVAGERYVLLRAASMSVAIRKALEQVVATSADAVMYKIGKGLGAADAEYFFGEYPDFEAPMKLALGPTQYPFLGQANVEIREESNPTTDEDCLLVVDHPNLYEAEAYIKAGIKTDRPLCFLSAGYAAGWCSKALGLNLEAKQILGETCGDKVNRFVIAPPSRIREHVKRLTGK